MIERTKTPDITKIDIVIKWLSLEENRNSLPTCTFTKSDYQCLLSNGLTYQMWGPDEVIYEVNERFYKIKYAE